MIHAAPAGGLQALAVVVAGLGIAGCCPFRAAPGGGVLFVFVCGYVCECGGGGEGHTRLTGNEDGFQLDDPAEPGPCCRQTQCCIRGDIPLECHLIYRLHGFSRQ